MNKSESVGWRFAARDQEGRSIAGTIQAETEAEALESLRSQHLMPVSLDRLKPLRVARFARRVDPRALSIFTRQFATLVDAALPLLSVIEMLSQLTEDRTLRKALKQVSRDLNRGHSLSDALRGHPQVFPPLYVHMVEAGEVGGSLPETLMTVADYMEASQALRDRVVAAMIYPAVVLSAAVLAVGLILTFVVPVFSGLFSAEGLILPLGTRILVAASEIMVSYWPFILAGIAFSVFFVQQILATPATRRQLDRVINSLPIIGELVRKAAVARLTRALASMVRSGVILTEALHASARISANSEVEAAIIQARKAIQGGSDLSTPLFHAPIIPDLLAQMVRVGEESGRLDEMLNKVADFFEMEVETAIEGAMKALEPALIVILGVVLGGIVVTMYMPIFDLMTGLG
jgi:type IV pilus assembly protein PilC